MRRATLRRRRSGAQWAILAAFALVVVIVGGVAAGLSAYVETATDVGVRATVMDSATDQFAIQVSADGEGEPSTENTAVTEHTAALLGDVPYDQYRSRVFGPRPVHAGPDGPPDSEAGVSDAFARALLVAYQNLPEHADLVEGQWPEDVAEAEPIPVALHARAAEELGIGVGDLLSIAQQDEVAAMRVTGHYLPREPDSAYWYGESREIDGSAAGTDLLIVLDDADLGNTAMTTAVGSTIRTRWRLAPVLSEMRTADFATLEHAVSRLGSRLEGDARLADSQVSLDDGIGEILRDSGERLRAVQAVTAVPLVLLALVAVVSLGLVGRLLVVVREAETALLRSRGASGGLLARWTVREALPLGVLPAALGGVAAWLLLRQLPATGATVSPVTLLTGAGAAATLAAAILIIHGSRASGTAVASTIGHRAEHTRRRTVLRTGTGLLIVVTAAVAVWQFRRYGGPTVDDASGSSRIDPLAVGAPAAALLAGGVLAVVAFSGLAWLAGCLVDRHRGLTGALAVRHLARRPDVHTLPVVLVVLAAGGGTLAAGFAGTWTGLQAEAAAQRTGGDLQVLLRPGNANAVVTTTNHVDLESFREIDGVERVDPVVQIPRAATADGAVTLLARPSEAGDVPRGVELPTAESLELVLDVTVQAATDQQALESQGLDAEEVPAPPAAPVHTVLWMADSDGIVSALEVEPVEAPPDGQRSSYRVGTDLPAGPAPWRVIGVEFNVSPPTAERLTLFPAWIYDYDIAVTGLRTDPDAGEFDLDNAGSWAMSSVDSAIQLTAFDAFEVAQAPSGVGFRVDSGGLPWTGSVRVRLVPEQPHTEPLPVVAAEPTLSRFGLAVGDQASLRFLGTELPVEIVDEVLAVPGTTAAEVMTADLTALSARLLSSSGPLPAVNQIWIEATDDALNDGSATAATAELAATFAGPDARVLDRVTIEDELRGNLVASVSVVVFWVSAAASVLLSGAGLAAAAAASARQRGPEVAVLRSLGCGPDQQARGRLRELGLTTVLAVALGTAAGWLVTHLSAGPLATAATSSPLDVLHPVLRVAVVPLASCLGALTVVGFVVAAIHAVRVRRQASFRPARHGVT